MPRLNRIWVAMISSVILLIACKPFVEKIKVSPEKIALAQAGDTANVIARPVDKNGNTSWEAIVSYESSAPTIAKVDDKGKVTAVANGTVSISIKIVDSPVKAEVLVTVGPSAK